jgi:hypothetical protein
MATDIKLAASSFARAVQADIKGGAYADAHRLATVKAALQQAYQGNYSPMAEALQLADGKTKKARAWHAGLVAAGVTLDDGAVRADYQTAADAMEQGGAPYIPAMVRKVPYVGALALPTNKPVRDIIGAAVEQSASLFAAAFAAVMAEKAERKVKEGKGEGEGEGEGAPAAPVALGVTESVQTVLAALKAGTVADEDVAELYATIAELYAVRAVESAATEAAVH